VQQEAQKNHKHHVACSSTQQANMLGTLPQKQVTTPSALMST
jgi:hypothetical protein